MNKEKRSEKKFEEKNCEENVLFSRFSYLLFFFLFIHFVCLKVNEGRKNVISWLNMNNVMNE
jgi:hypothetical protein